MAVGYFQLSPEQIFKDVVRSGGRKKVQIKDIDFLVHPHVYPSDKFRTTNFLLESLQPFLVNSHICDMGCGFGVVGLFALHHGATSIVQADINPLAVKNAKANKRLHSYTSKQVKIYESDCFDLIPKQNFDTIIFNIPFHCEPFEIQDPLQYAFHDPLFRSIKKFFTQVTDYVHEGTKILIAFSNKGDVKKLEGIFDGSGLQWELWQVANSDQLYDNRIYKLQPK